MEISFHSHLDYNTVIATKFCTWHDICAVVARANICCDLMTRNGITARGSFHRIWIASKKSLVKRAPGNLKPHQEITCTLQWRHNGHDSVSNHQTHDCLLNRLFRRRSKTTSKLRVTGLCAGNSPGTGEFPAQMASNSGKCFHLRTSSCKLSVHDGLAAFTTAEHSWTVRSTENLEMVGWYNNYIETISFSHKVRTNMSVKVAWLTTASYALCYFNRYHSWRILSKG